MKKVLIFCLGFFLVAAQAFAQTDADHSDEKSKGEKMKTLLGLTEEQTAKFRDVVTERRAAIKIVKEDATLSEVAREEKLKRIDVAREEKFKIIFTPDQFTKWKAYKEEKKKD